MAEIVASILAKDAETSDKFQSVIVEKPLDLEFDVGLLTASDPNDIDLKKFLENKEEFLKSLARDNTQLLINKIWELPIERYEDVIVAKLPPAKLKLPREKPIPKEKPPTKWQEYAKTKGIQNKKKSKLVWDENAKEWKPRWGYNRVNDEKKDWVLEVPDNADPFEDQFAKRRKEKDERVAKNEFQRLRNIAKAKKIPVAGLGLTPTEKPPKEDVTKARQLARLSTASVGKFTKTLPKEKVTKKKGQKRKFEPLIGDMNKERELTLDILNRIVNKKSKLDTEKLVANVKVQSEEKRPQRSAKRRNKDKRGRNKPKGGAKGPSKNFAGKGQKRKQPMKKKGKAGKLGKR